MGIKRKHHAAELKARVALAVLGGTEQSVSSLSRCPIIGHFNGTFCYLKKQCLNRATGPI